MKKLQEFMISGLPIQETDEEDLDIQEKEIREWSSGVGGPAGSGSGIPGDDGGIEPAASDMDLQESDLERSAKLVLRQRDTTLWGMNKTDARKILRDAGYSDSFIKSLETSKETKINETGTKLLKELGLEFPGAGQNKDFPGSGEHTGTNSQQNTFDGSAYGSDGDNLGDLQQRMDPNTDMEEPLFGIVKPYSRDGNTSTGYSQTEPSSLDGSGISGYKGSLPSYQNRSSMGEKKIQISVKKVIERAVARGMNKEQIKELLKRLNVKKN